MNILLIDTGYSEYELDEPLGIETLYASIKNQFDDLVSINLVFTLIDRFFSPTNEYDMVCISANINNGGKLFEIIDFYYNATQLSPIIVGGTYATISAESLLAKYENIICVIGEGEIALNQLIALHLLGNYNFSNMDKVNNIIYSLNGNLVYTKRKVLDLQTVTYKPYRKYLNQVIKAQGLVRLETSRGCNWNRCTFCILEWKYCGTGRRCFNLSRVVREIIDLSYAGAEIVYFTDEEFISDDYERLENFIQDVRKFKEEKKINPQLEFFASTSTHYVLKIAESRIDLLEGLKEIGFKGFFLGIESGSDSQLNRYRKNCSSNDNIEALKLFVKLNLVADVGFILFDPMMTFLELLENIAFIRDSELNQTVFRLLKAIRIIPHTKYFEDYKDRVVCGQIDVSTLAMPYEFLDTRIGDIVAELNNPEQLSSAYSLQSKFRAGVANTRSIEQDLCSIRLSEFMYFQKLVSEAANDEVKRANYERT